MTEGLIFKLPDVGEGLVEAEIVSWKVKPGDTVAVNDVIVEIETAKSLVELPSPYAGTVTELLAPEGQVVPVGAPIIRVTTTGGEPEHTNGQNGDSEQPERISTLVGYGPRESATKRRPRKPAGTAGTASTAGTVAPVQPEPTPEPAPEPEPAPAARTAGPVLAKPPVRKLAKDLGIDLHQVTPTGPSGTVTRADVEAYAEQRTATPATGAPTIPAQGRPTPSGPAAPGERETRVPVRGVRRTTAQAVAQSAFSAPHVTEWVTVDVTATMQLLDRLRADREFADVKLSPLVLAAKACCLALRRTPELNAHWDEAAGEIVLRHYVNLGIAAATPRGLLVPHIKDAERHTLPELARALGELTRVAREGTTPPSDMMGTTFTITNVGVFGVDGGTPILNPGETGILALGAARRRPWVVVENGEEQIVPRWVTTLSLSFDHRVVDGEQGSRFLTDVAGILSDPGTGLMY